MGVNGLWTVIQPCARPTNLATLNRKRLAVDASIWIYQFLKAVRDKEGNALRNSHVVGFFRRICKLLWFGILPVFVFDGGAPALKRATLQKRQRRREGRREDAVRTAGKLLAVQMQRFAVEEEDRRKREQNGDIAAREARLQEEDALNTNDVVYLDEIGMSQKEKAQSRRFHKQDAYHLPELDGGIASMGRPDDPRIMSVDELEEYARQFNNGEDVNLYDFSKIDFDGEFFKSLPPPDRYNILNAARLRSRLRMGLSKDQLDDMFPDRMAFSRFQIERVKERNHLTQRLMFEVGMQGTDLTLGVNARVAGEKDREYILVKNEGAEGGWALGVVSKEKDIGEAHKPIDVDAIEIQYQTKDDEDDEEDNDFEDVPIEGLNRLPKPKPTASGSASFQDARDICEGKQQFYDGQQNVLANDEGDGEESLFVGGNTGEANALLRSRPEDQMHPEEEDDISRAIALSLKNQHDLDQEPAEEELDGESAEEPEWTQKAVEASRPIKGNGGSMIAHVVNNRANAAVPKRKEELADSDRDDDLQAILARSRKGKVAQPRPVFENKKNPFDGPLPFPKLDWKSSVFVKKAAQKEDGAAKQDSGAQEDTGPEEDMGGGFEVESRGQDGPKPLPPWLADDTDIRESLKKQHDVEREINAEDRQEAEEEQRLRRRNMESRLIEIDSSSDGGSDIEIVEEPPSPRRPGGAESASLGTAPDEKQSSEVAGVESLVPEAIAGVKTPRGVDVQEMPLAESKEPSPSPEPEFEDVLAAVPPSATQATRRSESPLFGDVAAAETQASLDALNQANYDDAFAEADDDEYSDPEDEELLRQMAEEAEEHARFASELNQKPAAQNREDYEKELRALRSQQKKDRRDADEVTQVMVTECQSLLRLFGIPYITAPMEAEAQCAELVNLGIVDGIVTDDSDTFLFGGTRVYKNMFNSNKFVECYLGADLEKELSLSREQLISLAQLLGSDYTEGLSGVGPVTAVEILSEFPGKTGLEEFRDWWTAVQSQAGPKEADASSQFRRKFRKSQATKLFLPVGFPNPAVFDAYLHPEVDDSAEVFQWGVPDVEGLRRFLMSTIGWSKERTDEVLVPVIRDMNKRDVEGTQSNITRYFGGSVGPIATIGARALYHAHEDKGHRHRVWGIVVVMDQRELESRVKALTKSVAANEPPENAIKLLDMLKKDAAPTEEMLRATRAGVFVGKLRSNPNKEIARAAAELVIKWKKLVEQEKNSKLHKAKIGSPAAVPVSLPSGPAPGSKKAFIGDPEKRKFDTDGVDIKRTDSNVRNQCIGLVYNGLAFRSTDPPSDVMAKAVAVEQAVMDAFKGENAEYKKKIRSLFSNLKTKTNKELGRRVLTGDISPERFATMTDDDLKSDDQRRKDKELEKENMKKAQVPMAEKSISESLECGRCKKKKVSYTQAQTRAADEPMTTFCECMNCGNRWKFS
ncbi:transcription factor s-II (TFIIS), central domain-containing protein [Hirsutella rhossiliensis]|uniref:Transcription factor s-II (TFIIS), central domain-containing protein n=1 Tax=Hirsutella rhossiliensis TaxID=111463 RepID=A0A9P8MW61_9HYPO|nr:transcription factor s-II (TFIIS), central domain-containing protein [Hirsutella rhossiliensis]KAH0962492.1 transcription factor s-II (TFIIS), central domain-containing protein [Hirsutella rhossiliensis]